LSTKTQTSKGKTTPPKGTRDRLAPDQSPTIDKAYGMLQHLAKRKPVSITKMSDAVRRRAKKKQTVNRLMRSTPT
jgi:hypothetical protein